MSFVFVRRKKLCGFLRIRDLLYARLDLRSTDNSGKWEMGDLLFNYFFYLILPIAIAFDIFGADFWPK